MSVPPSGGWPPPQQPGQPPSQGQPYGQPYDPSGYNPQQPPPPGWQQGAWAPHSAPPPQKGNSLKWLLIGVAVLLVVAISVGATLLLARDGNGGGTTPSSGAPSDIASANDTGPVAVITAEPTCDAYISLNNGLADAESNGWSAGRSGLGAVSTWTAEQRSQVAAVSLAMTNASDQMVSLATRTPHRVVRELYEQFIAYGRAYSASVTNYKASANFFADANVNIGSTLLGICNSITYKSTSRSLSLKPAPPPTQIGEINSANNAQRFVNTFDSACDGWVQREKQFIADNVAWATLDANIPASQWTPEQRQVQLDALPILAALSTAMEQSGRQSGNPVFEDFAVLAAVYVRAYVTSGDDYLGADSWLSFAGLRMNNAISGACQAEAK